jgi:Ca2+-dependent lipid-binding protein
MQLNPKWNEKFTLPVGNPDSEILKFDVFDFDATKAPDPMGSAQMPLASLKEVSILRLVFKQRF